MATVFVPGVALTNTKGFIGAQPWAVVHHWQNATSSTPWSSGDLITLTTAIANAYSSALGSWQPSNVQIQEVDAIDLTSGTALGYNYTFAPKHGTRTGTLEPSSVCFNVANIINSRYRGGHPRTFWPGSAATDMQDESHWTAGMVSNFNNAMTTWFTQIKGAAYTFGTSSLANVIVRYTYNVTNDTVHKKYVRTRTGVQGVYPVQTWATSTVVGSQRRRLRL